MRCATRGRYVDNVFELRCTRAVARPRLRDEAPPSLHRVLAARVPRLQWYYEVLRFPNVLHAALRFLRATLTIPRACLRRSCQVRRRLGAGGFWVWHLPKRPVDNEMETPGRPKFLGNPDVPAPCSSTPARPTLPQASTVGRHGPTHRLPRGLSTRGNFGAQSHGIGTRCLRFAVRITPPHARLASGCGPRSTRRDWLPAGLQQKVSEMLLTSLPPSPSFLAQAGSARRSPAELPTDPYMPN
jgi:hypothetical protein